jgi:hypothetical protein
MRFSELQEADKVQYVKDTFALLCEVLANDPSRITEYFPIEPPKKGAELSSAEIETARINKEIIEKVGKVLSGLKPKSGCTCVGKKCIDINLLFNPINPELEPLIDVCRKYAEQRVY